MRLEQRLTGGLPLTRGPESRAQAIEPPHSTSPSPRAPLQPPFQKPGASRKQAKPLSLHTPPPTPQQRFCIQLPEEEAEN